MLGLMFNSVSARLGKGQGAKEIGHNLARERPKFGHNLVHKRQQNRAHFYALFTFNSGTIQHANEMRSWHNFVADR